MPYPRYLGALLITWVLMWMTLAFLQRWALQHGETALRALLRGLVAAVGSGLSFWAISGIWTNPSPGEPNHWLRVFYWALAFLPGFLALLVGQPASKSRAP